MQPPVLAYHKIDFPSADAKLRGAFTSPVRFAKQISYLKKQNFNFFTASELIERFLADGRFPAKSIALTFDDGWKDNFTNAFPVLKKFGVKATIFLVPSCIGQTTARVVGEGETEREHLSRENILEMSEYGIEFGSHSLNHHLMNKISVAEAEYEATESKIQIENLLQKSCRVFAYPAGFFTAEVKEKVRAAGYLAAFSTVYGATGAPDVFALNRIEILRRDRIFFRFAGKIKSLAEN